MLTCPGSVCVWVRVCAGSVAVIVTGAIVTVAVGADIVVVCGNGVYVTTGAEAVILVMISHCSWHLKARTYVTGIPACEETTVVETSCVCVAYAVAVAYAVE